MRTFLFHTLSINPKQSRNSRPELSLTSLSQTFIKNEDETSYAHRALKTQAQLTYHFTRPLGNDQQDAVGQLTTVFQSIELHPGWGVRMSVTLGRDSDQSKNLSTMIFVIIANLTQTHT
jgi:hypothetical protein